MRPYRTAMKRLQQIYREPLLGDRYWPVIIGLAALMYLARWLWFDGF